MRVIAVAVTTLVVIIVGLSLRPTPHATAAGPEQARTHIDPGALQGAVPAKSLPNQAVGSFF
jgi:hypothetical protein